VASQKGAYALTDRGTYLALKQGLDLGILFEGAPELLNIYHVMVPNSDSFPRSTRPVVRPSRPSSSPRDPAVHRPIRCRSIRAAALRSRGPSAGRRPVAPSRLSASPVDLIFRGIRHAFQLLLRGDPEVMAIMWLSLRVSGLATALSLIVGVPVGMGLALRRFPGRTLLLAAINSGMGCRR